MAKIDFSRIWTVYFDFLGNETILYPEIHLNFFFHLVCKQNGKNNFAPDFIIGSDLSTEKKNMQNCAYLMR